MFVRICSSFLLRPVSASISTIMMALRGENTALQQAPIQELSITGA
jgi:hypothetical protein